jgi:hypothetical protein
MLSACAVATFLDHPTSQVRQLLPNPFAAHRYRDCDGPEGHHSRLLPLGKTIWSTSVTQDVGIIAESLPARKCDFVPSGTIKVTEGRLGFKKGFLVRDPDRLVMAVIEE